MASIIKERVTLDLIIQEIRTKCISQGLNTSEAMADYAVSLVTLDKIIGKNEFKRSKDSLILHITENAINLLLSMKDVVKQKLMLTQVYFTEKFKNEDHVVEQDNKLLNLHAQPLIRHVILYDRVKPDDAMILRQISLLSIIMTSMGDPTDPAVYKQAEAALASIMSVKDILHFIHLDHEKKRQRLQEIIKLVAGIRIFNQVRLESEQGESQNAIERLPKLLYTSINSTKMEIAHCLEKMNRWVSNLEHTMVSCFEWDSKNAQLLNYVDPTMDDREYEFSKNVLSVWQQITMVLRTMHINISDHLYEQLRSEDEMRSKILMILDKVKRKKLGVPTRDVYPDFLNLSQYWTGFQRRLVLVNAYNQMLKKMLEYSRFQDVPKAVTRAAEDKIEHDDHSDDSCHILHAEPAQSVEIILDSSLPLEFNGFCPVWLLLTGGLVVTSKPKVGVVKYMGKYYGFRDPRALSVFSSAPELFVNKVYSFGRSNPEYIDLLDLRTGLEHGWDSVKTSRRKRDKGIQTEVHPIQEYHDYRYRHSIWQLKKDACKLADLRNCKITSAQTTLSHWKRTVQLETYPPKETTCQTMRENSTNVPKLQNFAFGLRGHRDEVQHDVLLTRPVDEGPISVMNQVYVTLDTCTQRSCFRYGKCDCYCKCYGCVKVYSDKSRSATENKNF